MLSVIEFSFLFHDTGAFAQLIAYGVHLKMAEVFICRSSAVSFRSFPKWLLRIAAKEGWPASLILVCYCHSFSTLRLRLTYITMLPHDLYE